MLFLYTKELPFSKLQENSFGFSRIKHMNKLRIIRIEAHRPMVGVLPFGSP